MKLLLAMGLLLLLGCGLIYAFSPALPKAAARNLARETWALPAARQIDKLSYQQLKERNLWGDAVMASAVAASEPLTAPDWNIIGVASNTAVTTLLLSFSNAPERLIELKVGESLPGGAKIMGIEQDKIRILLNGKPRQLFLRRD
jgi:hypothetical protein